MTDNTLAYWNGMAKAAFMDAVTLPFRFPEATYDFKKATGYTEYDAKLAKKGTTAALAAGALITALGVAIGAGLPAAVITGVAFPYITTLASAGLLQTGTTNPVEKRITSRVLWPRTTAFRHAHPMA